MKFTLPYFVQESVICLVEFVSAMVEEMTPATDDPNIATCKLKEELTNVLYSNPFGK